MNDPGDHGQTLAPQICGEAAETVALAQLDPSPPAPQNAAFRSDRFAAQTTGAGLVIRILLSNDCARQADAEVART